MKKTKPTIINVRGPELAVNTRWPLDRNGFGSQLHVVTSSNSIDIIFRIELDRFTAELQTALLHDEQTLLTRRFSDTIWFAVNSPNWSFFEWLAPSSMAHTEVKRLISLHGRMNVRKRVFVVHTFGDRVERVEGVMRSADWWADLKRDIESCYHPA